MPSRLIGYGCAFHVEFQIFGSSIFRAFWMQGTLEYMTLIAWLKCAARNESTALHWAVRYSAVNDMGWTKTCLTSAFVFDRSMLNLQTRRSCDQLTGRGVHRYWDGIKGSWIWIGKKGSRDTREEKWSPTPWYWIQIRIWSQNGQRQDGKMGSDAFFPDFSSFSLFL
jgi:hypothetical protein